IDESTLNQADYWRRHIRQPVRFIQSIQVAHQLGARVFREMGHEAPWVAFGRREYRANDHWLYRAPRAKKERRVAPKNPPTPEQRRGAGARGGGGGGGGGG
ncbi:hypothetical protein, partial [Escherichia coli]|uniref:hypothetical protein n=1 Tax=Escherichia coli TaxID=562 RepID=UPI0020252910